MIGPTIHQSGADLDERLEVEWVEAAPLGVVGGALPAGDGETGQGQEEEQERPGHGRVWKEGSYYMGGFTVYTLTLITANS